MTTTPLGIAIICSEWGKEPDATAQREAEVLRAVLLVPSRHRFLLYPDSRPMRALVADCGAQSRVDFVRSVRRTRMHRRVWRRAKRLIRRRKRPPFAALLNDALVAAGADCAWMPGSVLVPLDLPYVATIGDLHHRTMPWFRDVAADGDWRERDRLIEEVVLRAVGVIVSSNASALAVREAYGAPPGGTHVVPPPTPSFAMDASEHPRLPRPADIPSRYLFYPATYSAQNNQVTAVRVLAAMSGMAAQPLLVLAGADHGTLAHVTREAEALGVASRVIHVGVPDGDRLVALYQHAEAMIHPSLCGGTTAALEAMALGCPVIAADIPGAAEQVGAAGILVDPFDPGAFVAAIRSLRHDALRREALVEAGMLRARGWSAPQYAAAVIALIDSRVAPVRALWR
ncbi:MAG: glycosyltransferase [Gemmatimonadaceae bacterium]